MGVNFTMYSEGAHSPRDTKLYDNLIIEAGMYHFPIDLPSGSMRISPHGTSHDPFKASFIKVANVDNTMYYVLRIDGFEYKDDAIVEYKYHIDVLKTFFLNYRSYVSQSQGMIVRSTDSAMRSIGRPTGCPMTGVTNKTIYSGYSVGQYTNANTAIFILINQGATRFTDHFTRSRVIGCSNYQIHAINAGLNGTKAGELAAVIDKAYAIPFDASLFTGSSTVSGDTINYASGTGYLALPNDVVVLNLGGEIGSIARSALPIDGGITLDLSAEADIEKWLPPYSHYMCQFPGIGWVDLDAEVTYQLTRSDRKFRLNPQVELDAYAGKIRYKFGSETRTAWGDCPRLPLMSSSMGMDEAQSRVSMLGSVYDVSKEGATVIGGMATSAVTSATVGGATLAPAVAGVDLGIKLAQANAQFDLDVQKSKNTAHASEGPSIGFDAKFKLIRTYQETTVNYTAFGNNVAGWPCAKRCIDVTFVESEKYWLDLSTAPIPGILGSAEETKREIEKDFIIW